MRVAYVCADPGVPVFGRKGAAIHVQEVLRGLIAAGARVSLFAARFDGDPPGGLGGVGLHRLPPVFGEGIAVREQAARASALRGYAMLVEAGPFDLVYERYSLWSDAGMRYASDAGVPGLLEVNAPLIEEQERHRGLSDRDGAEAVAERAFAAATALVAVSTESAAYLEAHPAARGRVHVVPNGVDPDRFPVDLPASCPAGPETFTVGFVGSLKPWHGVPVLVEAFDLLYRRNQRTRLLIVGDGPERPRLEADLSARGLQAASLLTSAVDPSAVPGLLASMDAATAPYSDQPAFYFSPLKVYEYMAARLPVVASRLGQLAELIEHEVNGLLCPADDARALAAALERLRREPKLRARLGQGGRATVLRGHSWEAVVGRILALAASARERCALEADG